MKKKCISNEDLLFCYPYNSQHIGSREEQQDAFAFSDMINYQEVSRFGAVAVLADGMGGLAGGRQASNTAVAAFMNSYFNNFTGNVYETMQNAAYVANEQVKALGSGGATLVAAVVLDRKLYWISIGDSRIYLYRDGRVYQLNAEHNYGARLDAMVAEGKLSPEEALYDPDRAALTSYLGIDTLEEINFGPEGFDVKIGDSVLICSDGLYRGISPEEIAHILATSKESVADDLTNFVLKKRLPAQDNITVLLVDLD